MHKNDIIEKMERGDDVPKQELQKIARKLVRYFKQKGFEHVSQDTRCAGGYLLIRVRGEVSEQQFHEASDIFPATKTLVQQPAQGYRTNYYSYFWV